MPILDMRNRRVRVWKIITSDGFMNLPFDHLDTYEENLEFSKKYIGRYGIARSTNLNEKLDDDVCEVYLVTFDDGQIGNFTYEELALVEPKGELIWKQK